MNFVKITPAKLKGEIKIPPSKSLCHRAVIAAGLSKGESIIDNVMLSEDIIATVRGVEALGAKVSIEERKGNRKRLVVMGVEKPVLIKDNIDCCESGSTLRFLIPPALLTGGRVTFTGRGKLVTRPLNEYYDIMKQQSINYSAKEGLLPLNIEGNLKPGVFKMKGNVSSQFITGLLFALPLLNGDSEILITENLESRGYVDLTMDILNKFSVTVENNNYKEFYIRGNQEYKNIKYDVEGDFSQAAFWLSAGTLGGDISCLGLDIHSRQGDKVVLDIINEMKGNLIIEENCIKASQSFTKCTTIDASECPDLVPVLAVLAASSRGTTEIIKAGRLRIKESDRLKAVASELNKLGADVEEKQDGLLIHGKDELDGGMVDSWNDHRIAMALAVASIRCREAVILKNSECVKKSYPAFWEDFKMLGGKADEWSMG